MQLSMETFKATLGLPYSRSQAPLTHTPCEKSWGVEPGNKARVHYHNAKCAVSTAGEQGCG